VFDLLTIDVTAVSLIVDIVTCRRWLLSDTKLNSQASHNGSVFLSSSLQYFEPEQALSERLIERCQHSGKDTKNQEARNNALWPHLYINGVDCRRQASRIRDIWMLNGQLVVNLSKGMVISFSRAKNCGTQYRCFE
jgi:hypothetical protein